VRGIRVGCRSTSASTHRSIICGARKQGKLILIFILKTYLTNYLRVPVEFSMGVISAHFEFIFIYCPSYEVHITLLKHSGYYTYHHIYLNNTKFFIFLAVYLLIPCAPSCSPLKINWRFGGTFRFHIQGQQDVLTSCFMLVSCLAYSLTLKMEEACSCETSADFQRPTQRYIIGVGTSSPTTLIFAVKCPGRSFLSWRRRDFSVVQELFPNVWLRLISYFKWLQHTGQHIHLQETVVKPNYQFLFHE
jgi:hypothetical protein